MWEPNSWREALDRLGILLGPEDAEEWLRETVRLAWGTESLRSLAPADLADAFTRMRQLVLDLEDDGVPAEIPDDGDPRVVRWAMYANGSIVPAPERPCRVRVAAAFQRTFGVTPTGPPWEVGWEPDRLSREEWANPF
jgi:hypothetical protein